MMITYDGKQYIQKGHVVTAFLIGLVIGVLSIGIILGMKLDEVRLQLFRLEMTGGEGEAGNTGGRAP